jgi:tetratricopeptide (TPR) repeat protein
MSKRWQKVEVQYLTKHATSKTVEELAERFHTDAAEVSAKLKELGLIDDPNGTSGDQEAAALAAFESGLAALFAQQHAAALESFRTAAAIGDEYPDLAARSRQYLEVAARKLAEAPEPDPFAVAVWSKNTGDLQGALAHAAPLAGKDERFTYLAAATSSLAGDTARALDYLAKAIEMMPRNRRFAANDPDFEALRGDASFAALVRG